MKVRDKRLRTFYQTSLGERSALETRRVDMIQERQSLEGGERLGGHCCYLSHCCMFCSSHVNTKRAESLFKTLFNAVSFLLLGSGSINSCGQSVFSVYHNLGLD